MKIKNRARATARIKASVVVDCETGCWLWQKTKAKNGYGTFALGGGRNIRAHRASYEAFKSEIPAGLDVCHKCDVRACVNPEHLFVGTRSANILDASAKNRVSRTHQKRGVNHPGAKLTDEKVADILRRLVRGEAKAQLARAFGVSDRTILLIARGSAWQHVARGAA